MFATLHYSRFVQSIVNGGGANASCFYHRLIGVSHRSVNRSVIPRRDEDDSSNGNIPPCSTKRRVMVSALECQECLRGEMKEEEEKKLWPCIQNISTSTSSATQDPNTNIATQLRPFFLLDKSTHIKAYICNICNMATPSRLPSTRRPPGAAAGRSRPMSMIEVPLASPRDNS
jgi:hypothetical protein